MSSQSLPPEAPPPATPQPRPREPIFNIPPGTLWLALAMVAVFALQSLLEGRAWNWLLNTFAFVSTTFWPRTADLPTAQGVMTLVSHAFLHADLVHLALNLGLLLAFGSFVERHLGLVRYLLVFALTAAAGALSEYLFRGAEPLALIGASGAVYGMTGAAIRFMFAGGGAARRRSALGFVGVFLGLNLVFGLTGLGDLLAGAAIGWKAHAGGFLVGALLSVLLGPRGLTRRGPA